MDDVFISRPCRPLAAYDGWQKRRNTLSLVSPAMTPISPICNVTVSGQLGPIPSGGSLQISGPELVIAHAADSFWRDAALNSVSPVLAAVLGGLVVSLIIERVQGRRSELRREDERQRAETERRSQLGLDIMKTAFTFYTRLIEATRVEEHEGLNKIDYNLLRERYQDFRIAARVLEEQLRVYLPGGEARWLWHGAVDMLSLRYYRLAHKGPRLDGMIKGHGQHHTDHEIPVTVRQIFPGPEQLKSINRVQFHNVVMKKHEEMLTKLINIIVHDQLDWAGDPVALPGRGSGLGRSD
jgi:hypothetical protein